ncbi:MAG: hypothetical protein KJP00_12155, partial [Bacteroidia bacterium]|nr:hypothetical protein [Bacteroidia bacterium]
MKVDFEFRPNGSIIYAFLVLIFFVASGCNYYVVKSLEKDNYSSINELDKTHKYFVVHHNEEIYKMEGISVDSDMISGTLALVQREVYYSEYRSKAFKKEERGILREVHIYLRDDTKGIELGSNQIPLSSVYELKIIKKDTGRDIAAYVVAAGATAAVVAIIASSGSKNEPKPSPNEEASCNCPYIYVNNGKEYIFEGETLSAALASNLERDDYMKLPSISPTENTYRLKIANELRERQFLDVAELIVINHQKENKVLLDKYGQPHLIRNTESPVEAISFNGLNLESTLSSTDRKVYFFNDEDYSNNGVLLKFKKPQGIKNAKLVLNGKNTLWADHVYTIYSSKYGKYYNKWMKNQEILPPSQRMDLILGQDIQISIYLLQKGGWE